MQLSKLSAGFNRTFMELKDEKSMQLSKLSAGFNRTFMELKVVCSCSDRGEGVFQSHLYGIESRSRRCTRRGRWVSIAPLWNWKFEVFSFWGRMLHVPRYVMQEFQSHLYGIESGHIIGSWGRKVAFQSHLYGIERRSVRRYHPKQTKFQSHLYGIERQVRCAFCGR